MTTGIQRTTMSDPRPARDGETLSDEDRREVEAIVETALKWPGSLPSHERAIGLQVAALRARTKDLETALDQINAEYDRVVALLEETTDRALNGESDLRTVADANRESDVALAALRAELAACEEDMRSLWMTLGEYLDGYNRDGVREARSVVARALNRFEGRAARSASGEDRHGT